MQCLGHQGGGALGDALTPGTPAGSMAASAHGSTYSHVAVVGGASGGERGAASATAAAAARRGRATPPPRSAPAHSGRGSRHDTRAVGWNRPPRDGAPLTAPLARWLQISPTSRRNKSHAQARLPAGHRGRVEPRKSLRAVAACNSGRWGGAEGQTPSGPCDPRGRTVLLSHVTVFAFQRHRDPSNADTPSDA